MPAGRPPVNRRAAAAADYDVLCARWRELAHASVEDTEAHAELKQIRTRLRALQRCPHDCPIVEIDVPPHSASSPQKAVAFRSGNAAGVRTYSGLTVVPRCVAHELLRMIASDREVDAKRMQPGGGRIGETGRISDIARQVAAT